jgi:ABC-type amino acid transport system permease subunit
MLMIPNSSLIIAAPASDFIPQATQVACQTGKASGDAYQTQLIGYLSQSLILESRPATSRHDAKIYLRPGKFRMMPGGRLQHFHAGFLST